MKLICNAWDIYACCFLFPLFFIFQVTYEENMYRVSVGSIIPAGRIYIEEGKGGWGVIS